MKSLLASVAALLVSAAGVSAQDPAPTENPFKPFDRSKFVEHVRGLGAGDEDIAAYESQCEEESVAHATESLLRKFHKDYDAAAVLAEDGDPKAALELAALIEKDEDPYVRAHSRYHLGRHFLDADDPDHAAQAFAQYLMQDKNRTPLDAEVAFFYGSALAEVPRVEHAATTFADFLELFPNAPERYRAVAAQRMAELEAQFESPLHQIADTMKGVEPRAPTHEDRRADAEDTQKDIVDAAAEDHRRARAAGAAERRSRERQPASSNNPASAPARCPAASRESATCTTRRRSRSAGAT